MAYPNKKIKESIENDTAYEFVSEDACRDQIDSITIVFKNKNSNNNEIEVEYKLVLKSSQKIETLMDASSYFSNLITSKTTVIDIEESDPFKAMQLVKAIVEHPDELFDYAWDMYCAILSSNWSVSKYIDKCKELAQYHINYVLSFDDHLENRKFSNDSCFLLYGSIEENINGCYNVIGCVLNEITLAKRDNSSIVTVKSNTKGHFTMTSQNSIVLYQSNFKSDTIHGDWTNGLKIKVIPTYKDVKHFWEILRMVSTYPQNYGSIALDKSRNEIIKHIAKHKELWIIEEMTQVLSMEELGYVLSSQLKVF